MIFEKQMLDYQAVINNGLNNQDDVTDWEIKFLRDFQTRLNTYGMQTHVSPKQDETFERIEEKLRKALGDDYAQT